MDPTLGLSVQVAVRCRASLRGKTAYGRLGRQTSARTKTSARLKITLVGMTYPKGLTEPPSLSPHFLLAVHISKI